MYVQASAPQETGGRKANARYPTNPITMKKRAVQNPLPAIIDMLSIPSPLPSIIQGPNSAYVLCNCSPALALVTLAFSNNSIPNRCK